MKKILLTSGLVLLVIIQTLAQPGGTRFQEKREQIEAMKIGFITRQLDLTAEEAKTFWPVYNEYQKDLDDLRKKRRDDRRDAKDEFDTMNDKDVEKRVDDEIVFKQNELDIIKKYHTQFKQVLPIKKVAKLYRSEDDFKRELLQKLKERRDMRPGK